MLRLSMLALVMTASSIGAASARDQEGKAGVIVMFGARWCAPCMALAWVDRSIALPPHATSDVHSLPTEEARRLAHGIAGDGYGLPFSVMFDVTGHACAVWRSPLHAQDLPAIRAQCARSHALIGSN
jgi:thiol-disulfide isomerase/thioredoxin